jgi:ligand-binding sensor domain-containing protein/serine phosphatase RsbU (regulator of sigma subunit)
MQRFSKFLIFLSLIFVQLFSIAQELKFIHINSDNGLSMSVVNCIHQDNAGYIWLGTEDGLNRYDGRSITVFKNKPKDSLSISDNWILAITSDSKGRVWIGTKGGGLNMYDPNKNIFKAFTHNDSIKNSISSDWVTSLLINKDELWVGTDNGVNIFDLNNFTVKTLDIGHKTDERNILSIYKDRNSVFWIGTFNGFYAYNPATQKARIYKDVDTYGEPKVKFSERVYAFLEDNENNFWIGTDAALIKFDRKYNTYKYYTLNTALNNNDRIRAIVQDSHGWMWVSTLGAGVHVYNKLTDSFKSFKNQANNNSSLANNNVRCITEDKAGSIWIGTNSGGASVYHRSNNQFQFFKREPDNPEGLKYFPMAIIEDKRGDVWLATYEGGIVKQEKETGAYINYPREINKNHYNFLSLLEAQDGKIWMGSWGGGLNYYNPETAEFSTPIIAGSADNQLLDNNILCFLQTDENTLWAGTLKGLNKINLSDYSIQKYTTFEGLSSNAVFTMYFEKDAGNLWLGLNNGGMNVMNLKTGKIKHYKKSKDNTANTISNNTVTCIYDDSRGSLWIGTRGGLNKFDKTNESFEHYFEKDGLPNDYVYGILGDKNGNLWISTNNGLSKFNPDNISEIENGFRNYFEIDGLQGNEFNQGAFYKSKSGKLYFGGVNGFNAFYPEDIKNNTHIPPIVITSFKKAGKEAQLDTFITGKKYIELSYKDYFFEFGFVALDFVSPSKNMYSYKLEGFDLDWSVPSTRNYASYTNLSGGDYIFKVRGCNNDGVWNDDGVEIHIKIFPPFYKTNTFVITSILIGLLSVFLFIRYRTKRIQEEKKILEVKVQERTIELAQKNKDITSSIQYAKRIQEAILPQQELIFRFFPRSFILYKPKDIVSGDFYWFSYKDNKKIIAAVDCTGHGVPGAFMSMIGHNLLNQIVNENGITDAAEILNYLNKGVQQALKQNQSSETRDGMDVCLCVFDDTKQVVEYAGAYRPLYKLDKNKELYIVDGNKFPIGGSQISGERNFTKHTIKINDGDSFYMFSDGYADQFGGDKGKKFMVKRFQQILLEIYDLSMKGQGEQLDKVIEQWKGETEQVDDILVIGVRY